MNARPVLPIELYRDVIFPRQCDAMGHLASFEYARMAYFALHHLFHALGADTTGADDRGWADVRQEIEYSGELRSGALVLVRGGVLKVGRSSLHTQCEVWDAARAVRAATVLTITTHFDLAARRSAPLPEPVAVAAGRLLLAVPPQAGESSCINI